MFFYQDSAVFEDLPYWESCEFALRCTLRLSEGQILSEAKVLSIHIFPYRS
jgi:hypothetical protein